MAAMPTETVAQRIRRQVQLAIRAGKFETEAEFLRAVGLSDGYFGELEQRSAKNPEATVRFTTATKMAELLGVSTEVLLGTGVPPEPPLVDVYPNRAWAIQAARALDFPEAAIQLVLKHDPGHDLHKVAWFRRIEAEAESLLPATKPSR